MKAPPSITALFVLLYGLPLCFLLFSCQETLTEDFCKNSESCKRRGNCGLKDNQCVPLKQIHCVNSRFCIDLGLCNFEEGKCIAKTVDDCRRSTQCKTSRRCIPSDGSCVEITASYCRLKTGSDGKPTSCQSEGACGFDSVNQTCVVKNARDCVQSTLCLQQGFCSVVQGKCGIQEDSDCRKSKRCSDFGECHAQEVTLAGKATGEKICVALSQQDCDQNCKDAKEGCIFVLSRQSCLSGKAHCKDTEQCRTTGQCTWSKDEKKCIVASDDDCENSLACKDAKRCKAYGGQCIGGAPDPCSERADCFQKGLCASKDSNNLGKTCVPFDDADCKASTICKEEGKCTKDSTGTACAAKEDKDCKASMLCKEKGLCSLDSQKGSCLAKTDEDCKRSQVCTNTDLCVAVNGSCVKQ